MSDLTDRLRGRYKVGPGGLYGTRDFSGFIPPICTEAADRIEQLEGALELINAWQLPKVESRGELVSYETARGTNGARDYMRKIASDAVKA